MPLIPLIFWSSTCLSVALSIAGVQRRSPWLLLVGAVLAGPIAFYLGATRLHTWGFFLPGLQVAAALDVKRSRWLAGVLVLPLMGLTLFLLVAVLSQLGR